MADISITATSVVKGALTTLNEGIAGATITAGQPIYKDPSAGYVLKPGQATSSVAANVTGIALNGGAVGQTIKFATLGKYTPGGTFVVGQVYVVSATAGGIAPYADLVTGNYVTVLGIATTASELDLLIHVGGIAKP